MRWFPIQRCRVFDKEPVLAIGIGNQLESGGAFRAETTLGDGRIGVAFYMSDALFFDKEELPAADSAVGADASNDFIGRSSPRSDVHKVNELRMDES